jgi:thymidylate kinase
MRVTVIGTEYAGKSTLVQAIQSWGMERGIRHHMDDHFSIPDQQTLKDPADQKTMTELPSPIKERFQRFQVAYHVRLVKKYQHVLLTGFHIEEFVYGQRYYYPDLKRPIENPQAWERDMPTDIILVHLTAKPDVIKQRMKDDPHDYPIVPESDIEKVQAAFQEEFRKSFFKQKFQIDTSELNADSLLQEFLDSSFTHLSAADHAIRLAKP